MTCVVLVYMMYPPEASAVTLVTCAGKLKCNECREVAGLVKTIVDKGGLETLTEDQVIYD